MVGKKALKGFDTAGDLQSYIHEDMPNDDPGSLSDADAWAVTAWILSKNGKLCSDPIDASNAVSVSVK